MTIFYDIHCILSTFHKFLPFELFTWLLKCILNSCCNFSTLFGFCIHVSSTLASNWSYSLMTNPITQCSLFIIAHFPYLFLKKGASRESCNKRTQNLKRAKCGWTLCQHLLASQRKNTAERKLTADVVILYSLPAWTRA